MLDSDGGKDLRMLGRSFAAQTNLIATHVLPHLAQHTDDVHASAATQTEQQHLHGSPTAIVAAHLRRGIHDHDVTGPAGCAERHAVQQVDGGAKCVAHRACLLLVIHAVRGERGATNSSRQWPHSARAMGSSPTIATTVPTVPPRTSRPYAISATPSTKRSARPTALFMNPIMLVMGRAPSTGCGSTLTYPQWVCHTRRGSFARPSDCPPGWADYSSKWW